MQRVLSERDVSVSEACYYESNIAGERIVGIWSERQSRCGHKCIVVNKNFDVYKRATQELDILTGLRQ
jgi:hypothetical protein